MMFTICKKFRFEAAHVLTSSHSEECQKIHGHSYEVEFFFERELLDEDGMVIDFGLISEFVKPNYIDEWDHALITENGFIKDFGIRIPQTVRTKWNPTAENMALHLFKAVRHRFPELVAVRVHETATGWAEYREESR